MTSIFRKPLLSLFSWFARGLEEKGAILMYHSVGDNRRFFTVRPKEFERQMNYLKKRGFKVVPLSALIERVREKKAIDGEVAITFDDGYRDVYQNAFPILKQYGFPATVFVITGLLGEDGPASKDVKPLPLMTKDELREMHASGLIEFMPHTASHPELSKIAHAEAVREVEASRRAVEELTKTPADILAFPKGDYTREILIYLKRNDAWLGAVTTKAGLVAKEGDPFLLPRLPVDSATSFGVFKALLSDAAERYEKLKGKR